ncbi:DUF3105 domain-containing protein [Blastococcus sp. URHD0036]|uniref:DUF3105 domain-containing protein n=1 Tax=Blastococcus sp. URHD0036 TaxID=1380356 RepID=UPI00068FB7A8|nr:DUF3105 domain-containing protein [Blastococcus sp. URHD0036]
MSPRRAALLAGAATLVAAGCSTSVEGAASPASGAGAPLGDTRVADYEVGQLHEPGDVEYAESPPVGGPHAAAWADCTGSVYDVPIRPENAVHSLEHGAVWVTYDPALATADDVAALEQLVAGVSHRLLSPYEGLGSAISIQAWNHQLAVDSADDPRLAAFADQLTQDPENTPEPGATCENPAFLADPETA